MKTPKVLVIIPARGGSKRVKNKNIRPFAHTPLIARTIRQAQNISFADRIVVDTDSPEIAEVAKKYGAEVPFLRPARLAKDSSQMIESVLHMLSVLERDAYKPDYVLLLQTTSPLREMQDIDACWKRMKESSATTVLTVAPTHPQLYHIDTKGELSLANKKAADSTNTQAWRDGYLLNGCFVYLVQTKALKRERRLITKKTSAVICPRWRSVDLDTPEDWVIAELIEKNKAAVTKRLKNFS